MKVWLTCIQQLHYLTVRLRCRFFTFHMSGERCTRGVSEFRKRRLKPAFVLCLLRSIWPVMFPELNYSNESCSALGLKTESGNFISRE